MRILKILLIVVLALVAIVCLLGFTGPDAFRYERSATMKAPPEVVYDNIRKFSNMNTWGPWQAIDPEMVNTFEGTDGEVGSVWKWTGSKVGTGQQELVAAESNRSARSKLTFTIPIIGDMESFSTLDLAPHGDSTKVTWSMEGKNGFWGRVMGKFGDSDAQLGAMFEQGLAGLKAMSETQAAAAAAELAARTSNGYLIETVERPELVFIGKRNRKVKWADLEAFYSTTFAAAGAAVGAAGLAVNGPPSGVFWDWNEKDQTADLMVAMPVKGDVSTKVEGLETHVIPAGRMLQVAHFGSYDKSMAAHEAVWAFIESKGLSHYGNVIEEYVIGPMSEKDTTKWRTDIYYMVK